MRNGVGVHHAGMLPRYRRLVERLAGQGLLPVICGTDTLGVGVNIPIRTVLMTALTKFDGTRVRRFSVREFHQLAGRAGPTRLRPRRARVGAGARPRDRQRPGAGQGRRRSRRPAARRRRAADAGGLRALRRGGDGAPRRRPARSRSTSRFRVTADLVASVLSRPDGPAALKHLLRTNHDPEPRRRQHQRRAIAVYRSLEAAGVAERLRDADGRCLGVRVGSLVEGEDERSALRFSSPLMTFAIEVIATLDRDDPAYVVDVVSVVESVLDDPRQILHAQQNAAKGAEVARLKAEGVPYEERMERLESITWPTPLAELLDASRSRRTAQHHPWVTERAVAEVDPARDARGRRHVRHVRAALPARAQRGARAALPHRRVADARPLAARRRLHRRRSRTSSSGSAS